MVQRALLDAGPLTAFYNKNDAYHDEIVSFFENTTIDEFITTDACIAEVMHNLKKVSNFTRVQVGIAEDIGDGLWTVESPTQFDFLTIAELLKKYSDVPADYADITLVVVSKRLNISKIVTLDKDFDIYKRLTEPPHPFERIFYPSRGYRKRY